jgi:hypothetical protein
MDWCNEDMAIVRAEAEDLAVPIPFTDSLRVTVREMRAEKDAAGYHEASLAAWQRLRAAANVGEVAG